MRDDMLMIKDDYEGLLKEHSPSDPKAVGWADRAEQQRRLYLLLHDPNSLPVNNVLDIGCGRAATLTLPGIGALNTYTGIDFMQEHIDYCISKYGKLGNVKFACAEAIDWLEQQSLKWETVIASGTLAHYTSRTVRDLLARMWFVTKTSGRMAVNWNRLTCGITARDMLIILSDIGVEEYILRHDYIPHDYTVHCYK